MGYKQTGLVTFRWSSSFVVAEQYTLPVVLHILRVDSDDKGHILRVDSYDKGHILRVDSHNKGHILRVDSHDKGTGYAAGSLSSPAYLGKQADGDL